MKKIVDGKTYNTDTAELMESYQYGYTNDFGWFREYLYVTSKGNHFLYGKGGPLSHYAEHYDNSSMGGEDIVPLTREEAFDWAQRYNLVEVIGKTFSDMCQDA